MEIQLHIFTLNQYLVDRSHVIYSCSRFIQIFLADALKSHRIKNAFLQNKSLNGGRLFLLPPGKQCSPLHGGFSRRWESCHTVEEWDLRGLPFKLENPKVSKQAQLAALTSRHFARPESVIISRRSLWGRDDSKLWTSIPVKKTTTTNKRISCRSWTIRGLVATQNLLTDSLTGSPWYHLGLNFSWDFRLKKAFRVTSYILLSTIPWDSG